LADRKCLDSLFQNDLLSIQSGTKGAGDLMNGVQSVVQDSIDFLAENWIISEGEKKNASVDIIRTGMLEN